MMDENYPPVRQPADTEDKVKVTENKIRLKGRRKIEMVRKEMLTVSLMTDGYPIDGKSKEKTEKEKMHPEIKKRYIAFAAIAILLIGIVAYFAFAAQTPVKNSGGMMGGSEVQTAENPAVDAATGAVSTEVIYDIYGNKINPDNIISVGSIALIKNPGLETPPRLVRDGLIDITVAFAKRGTVDVMINKIPDSAEKLTFLRTKIYDEKGLVQFKKWDGTVVDYPPKDIRLSGTEAYYSLVDNLELVRPLYGDVQKVEAWIYFTKPDPLQQSGQKREI